MSTENQQDENRPEEIPPENESPKPAAPSSPKGDIEAEIVDSDAPSLDSLPPALSQDERGGKPIVPVRTEITAPAKPARQRNDHSDTDAISDDSEDAACEDIRWLHDWDNELSVAKVAVELKHIECEVRRLLEGHDPKRRRKLAGSYRWLELEEDLRNLHYSGIIGEPTLTRIELLVAKRHHLFRRLRFLAGTRPTWNT